MKICALILSLTLLATPCMAGVFSVPDGVVLVAAQGEKSNGQPTSRKMIIKGKGGKVTDVDKKPKKDGKKKSE